MATPYTSIIAQARQRLNEIYQLVRPNAPLVSAQGTTGATTYTYVVVALNATGSSAASPSTSITNGNAALSGTNFNQLTWATVPYATGYDVYRTVGGSSTGKIVSNTTALTANDTGLAGGSETAPTVNTSGITDPFWTDDELFQHALKGTADLWGALLDLFQSHFLTIDETNVSLAANATSLTGVPSDVFRVYLIEPRDTTVAGAARNIRFVPRPYNSPDFINARAENAYDPSGELTVYYDIIGAGSPVGAPTIKTAPALTTAVNLRFVYVPTLGLSSYTVSTSVPIPAEADNALISWVVAFALGKEHEEKTPDAGWLSIYATEKQAILTRSTPRQQQEAEYVEGMFEGYW